MSEMGKITKRITLSGLFLALGVMLPFMTAQIPQIGSMLLPMHIPIMICGYVCGWKYGLVVGMVTPIFRGVVFGMPPLLPTGVTMSVELAVYGVVTGFLYNLLKERKGAVYISLILAMTAGRVAWGAASVLIYGVMGNTFSWTLFIGGALVNALPGIILQLILIPVIIYILKKNSLMEL